MKIMDCIRTHSGWRRFAPHGAGQGGIGAGREDAAAECHGNDASSFSQGDRQRAASACGLDVPQVCDAQLDSGPLAGLAAGMEGAATPWIFAVACDMPFINPAVIEYLAGQRTDCQAVVPWCMAIRNRWLRSMQQVAWM